MSGESSSIWPGNGPSLWYPIWCWGDNNIGSTSLILVREGEVSPPVISLSLDICLVVFDVLLVLAGIGGSISSSCTLAGIGGGISSSCTLAGIIVTLSIDDSTLP